jgi:hypothetical protein
MTLCEDCNCYLGSNQAIEKHLNEAHCVRVKLGEESYFYPTLIYCRTCMVHLISARDYQSKKRAVEMHLWVKHGLIFDEEH